MPQKSTYDINYTTTLELVKKWQAKLTSHHTHK